MQNIEKAADFRNEVTRAVAYFLEAEEEFSDNAQLAVDTAEMTAGIVDPDEDKPGFDYFPVMDLVMMDPADPGQWIPDEEAIESVVAEYFPE